MNRTLTIAVLSVLLAAPGVAENWPRFRGNNGAGISESVDIPSQWSEADYLWVADLRGVGNSSPVIWEDKLFVSAADEGAGKRWLICLHKATGKVLWRGESEFVKYKKHKNNTYASSTPAVDENQVYQLWHSKQGSPLIAYSHEGIERWRYDLGPYLHGQGGATSPVVAGDLVVVAHDHKADSFLIALDRQTGKPRWKIPREGKRACYSTPCVRNAGGKQQLVFVHCYEGIIGVDPASGEPSWHLDPFGRESQRALASPVIAGDLVIAGSGAVGGDRQIVAVAVDDDNEASEAYRLIRQSPHVPTPLVMGDRLFLWNDGGIVTCCDADDGSVIWQKRVGGNYFASPIAIDDRIFSISTTGEVVVISADDEFRVIAKNQMEQGSKATMATSDNVLFIRTDSKVFAVAGQRQRPEPTGNRP